MTCWGNRGSERIINIWEKGRDGKRMMEPKQGAWSLEEGEEFPSKWDKQNRDKVTDPTRKCHW